MLFFTSIHHLPVFIYYFFFFFKQKTAYEMLRSLVGSEMCIRDRLEQLQKEEEEVLAGISKVKDSEVEQSQAVRGQKKMWCELLEFRVALQGTLMAASRMPKPQVYDAIAQTQDPAIQHRLDKLQKLSMDMTNDLRQAAGNLLDQDLTVHKACGELPQVEPSEDVHELWENLDREHEQLRPWREAEITRWYRKTTATKQLQAGKALQTLAKSTLDQVSEVMSDMPRLLKRTQLKRGEYTIVGDSSVVQQQQEVEDPSNKRDGHLYQHDEEIFDDTDFYERLLQELVESGSHASLQAATAGKAAVRKSRPKVDTRASKGRKIRYHVHAKLVNFMSAAGFDMPPVAEELFARLFGQTPESDDDS
eukprot:TRINITY_DN59745_c0_g1_i2.p1 TRINITY_DN59745_c0_g1~~TRINITY_DN59745_c0_g1_i2.p1  ORF type:complete len:362 (+),score=104.06 TRINITY_DN59745_c0_g1_i2:25-1110(+)